MLRLSVSSGFCFLFFVFVFCFFFNLLLSFFWLCKETLCLPTPPSWPEVPARLLIILHLAPYGSFLWTRTCQIQNILNFFFIEQLIPFWSFSILMKETKIRFKQSAECESNLLELLYNTSLLWKNFYQCQHHSFDLHTCLEPDKAAYCVCEISLRCYYRTEQWRWETCPRERLTASFLELCIAWVGCLLAGMSQVPPVGDKTYWYRQERTGEELWPYSEIYRQW